VGIGSELGSDTAATRKRNVSLGPQITSEDLADLRQEDDIRTIPIRHQHPFSKCDLKSGHTLHKTIPAAPDSIGFPRVSLFRPTVLIIVGRSALRPCGKVRN
jgi:hypothetical protein